MDFGPVLLLVPIWLYFFLRIARQIPVVKIIFFKRRYRVGMKVLGVFSGVFVTLILFANIINIRQLIHVLFVVVLAPVMTHFVLVLHVALQRRTLRIRTIHNQTNRKSEPEQKSRFIKIDLSEPNASETADYTAAQSAPKLAEVPIKISSDEHTEEEEVSEEKRRAFIKLLAGAGAGVFLTSLLNPGKASAAFFGSVPGPGVIAIKDSTDTKIDPSIKSPTDGYGISNVDSASYPAFYGFVNKDGAWYILQENPQNTFLYSKGASSFSTNWTGRAGLTYGTYDVTF